MTGITGGIGSGKSTIANELAKRGYTVYDCDREAKRIIAENAEVQQAIMALLGAEAFVNGIYNTQYVAKRVFSDNALLTRLNAIIHPAIQNDILTRKPDFVGEATPDNIEKVRARMRTQNLHTLHPFIRINNDGLTPITELTDQIIAKL